MYHYMKIIVVRLCVRLCVSYGRSVKTIQPKKQEAVYLAIEWQKLEMGNLCECQPWH